MLRPRDLLVFYSWLLALSPPVHSEDCIDYAQYIHRAGFVSMNNWAYPNAVAVGGDYAYCPLNSGGLQVIDVSDPDRLRRLSYCAINGAATDITLHNGWALLAVPYLGLEIVSLSNPRVPTLVRTISITGAEAVTAIGTLAFVAAGASGLKIVDISTPSSAAVIGTVDTPGRALGVAVTSTHAFVADETAGLQVIDITTPTDPVLVGAVDTPDTARAVTIIGSRAYVADTNAGVRIVDISLPTAPMMLGSFLPTSRVTDVVATPSRLFAATIDLAIAQLDDPDAPVEIGHIDSGNRVRDLAVSGSHCYFVKPAGLVSCDVAGSSFVPVLSCLSTAGSANAVAVANGHAFLVEGPVAPNWSGRLLSVDVSEPARPVAVDSMQFGTSAICLAVGHNLAFAGTTRYDANNAGKVAVVDISQPDSLEEIASLNLGDLIDIALVDTLLYGLTTGSLSATDVSDPRSPRILSSVGFSRSNSFDMSGDYAYVGTEDWSPTPGYLHIVDVSAPDHLVTVGSLPFYGTPCRGVSVHGDRVYVTTFYSGIVVVDVSNPTTPVAVDTLTCASGQAVFAGAYAFVAEGGEGLSVLDVSGAQASLIGRAPTKGFYPYFGAYPQSAIWGDHVFVPGGLSGLYTVPAQCYDWGATTLTAPPPGATVTDATVPFAWTGDPVDYYELWVDDEVDFSSPEISPFQLQSMGADRLHTTSFPWGDGWLQPGHYYWKVRAYIGGSYRETTVSDFTYSPPVELAPAWGPLYRLYKNADRDHFYCTSDNHRGIALAAGYRGEGVEGFVSHRRFSSPDMVELYRFYSDALRSHFYTSNPASVDSLIRAGLRYEGITGYAYGTPQPGLVPLHQLTFRQGAIHDQLNTVSEIERQEAPGLYGFTYDGIVAYVSPTGGLAGLPAHAQSGMLGMGLSPGTGNFQYYTQSSFDIPDVGLPLNFGHTYNSNGVHLLSQLRPLGPGWTHTYNACILTVPDQWLVLWPDGSVHRYSQSSRQCLDRELGVYDSLTVYSGGRFEVTKKNQLVYLFERPIGKPFDYPSLLSSIRDRNGNTITCSYDPTGLLTQVAGTTGRTLSLTYEVTPGSEYRLVTVNDNAGNRAVHFAYADSSGILTSYTDCAGLVTQYHYAIDPVLGGLDHQLAQIILPRGNRIDNLYEGRKIKRQTSTGDLGRLTLTYLDATHVEVANAAGHRALQTFDSFSRLQSVEDLSGSAGTARVEREDPQNPALPTSIWDRNGNHTHVTYDNRGNARTVDQANGAHWAYEYDSKNNVTSVTDPLGHETTLAHDSNGNLVQVTDALSRTTTYARRLNGLIESVTNPLSHRQLFSWNAHGDLAAVEDALGHLTTYLYDAVGRVTRATDAENHATTYTYDCVDRMTTLLDANGGTTSYAYDGNGNPTTITDALGNATSWGYNDLDLMSSITNALGLQTSFSYNDDGSLRTRNRSTGSTAYTYDSSGRLAGISSTGAALTRDANGNVTGIVDANGSESFAYDALNRLTRSTDYFTNSVSYAYDAAGNLQTLTYPDGKVVSYSYYEDNRLRSVTDWHNQVTTYYYRADGSPDRITYPNGVTTTFRYDGADRLISLVHRRGDGLMIAEYAYTLNGLGYPVSESRTEPLTPPQPPQLAYSGTYDAANRITSYGPNAYAFDGAGNMTSRSGPEPLALAWDLENRLTSISGSFTASYVYDTFGNRVAATRSGVTRRYALDLHGPMSEILMEADAAGAPLAYYVYGTGLISRIAASGEAHYYHWDNVGSVVALTDASGNITHKYAYDPYGQLLGLQEANPNPIRFVGRWGVIDEHLGLYFMRARYYDSHTGRFLSQDPKWDPNLFEYANSTPQLRKDPNGRSASPARDAIDEVAYNLAKMGVEWGWAGKSASSVVTEGVAGWIADTLVFDVLCTWYTGEKNVQSEFQPSSLVSEVAVQSVAGPVRCVDKLLRSYSPGGQRYRETLSTSGNEVRWSERAADWLYRNWLRSYEPPR